MVCVSTTSWIHFLLWDQEIWQDAPYYKQGRSECNPSQKEICPLYIYIYIYNNNRPVRLRSIMDIDCDCKGSFWVFLDYFLG